MRLDRVWKPACVKVSNTPSPCGSSSKVTLPVLFQAMTSFRGASATMTSLCIRCSSDTSCGRGLFAPARSSFRQTSSNDAPATGSNSPRPTTICEARCRPDRTRPARSARAANAGSGVCRARSARHRSRSASARSFLVSITGFASVLLAKKPLQSVEALRPKDRVASHPFKHRLKALRVGAIEDLAAVGPLGNEPRLL